MTIGIDVRILGKDLYSGIPEYTFNLVEKMVEISPENKYKLFFNSLRPIKADIFSSYQNVEVFKYHFPNKLLDISSLLFKQPKIEKFIGKIDIFFSPHFNIIFSKAPRVLVIHDLSFKYFPEFFNFKRKIWHFFMAVSRQIGQAKKIIVDSESTKNTLKDVFKVSDEKIKVIYGGLEKSFEEIISGDIQEKISLLKQSSLAQKVKAKYNLPENYFLYLGTIEPRKNILNIAKAFCLLKEKEQFKNYHLVLAGKKGWLYKDVLKKISNLSCKNDIIFTGPVSKQEKRFVYLFAKAFVYPSFFEGFGFPPLEAMACQVPVIVSNRASLPEVVQGSALLVDPYNIWEIAKALEEIAISEKLRNILTVQANNNLKRFSWHKSAKDILNTFQETINYG